MLNNKILIPALCAPLAALTLAAGPHPGGHGEEIELDEAEVFVEFNSTDGDFGIQFFWDGEGWDRMKVENTEGTTVLQVRARRNLADQGLTEAHFESVEPGPGELTMEEFLERFPEGEYEFEGVTLEGDALEGEAEFTHVIPSPPANLWPADGDSVNAALPLTVSFDAVTQDLDGNPLSPVLYEVVVETEGDILQVLSVILKGDVANPQLTVPPEWLEAGTEYKLEVIVQEESGNRSITETEFETL